VRAIAAAGAIGAYHHGSRTDRLWARGASTRYSRC
jgi:hypothetical protein